MVRKREEYVIIIVAQSLKQINHSHISPILKLLSLTHTVNLLVRTIFLPIYIDMLFSSVSIHVYSGTLCLKSHGGALTVFHIPSGQPMAGSRVVASWWLLSVTYIEVWTCEKSSRNSQIPPTHRTIGQELHVPFIYLTALNTTQKPNSVTNRTHFIR